MNVLTPLPREFYLRDALTLARDVLGRELVCAYRVPFGDAVGRVQGRIVEAEAYMGESDDAAHVHQGRRSPRTEVLYGPGGHAYVYLIYGMYYCLNLAANVSETPHCVLIRAVEPLEGVEVMQARRKKEKPCPVTQLCAGPGRLCRAFGIDKSCNGLDMTNSRLYLLPGTPVGDDQVWAGPRIGVDYAEQCKDKPWRFCVKNNPFVSKPQPPK